MTHASTWVYFWIEWEPTWWWPRMGLKAWRPLKSCHPHMVLSDIAMPGMDGFELLRKIRALGAALTDKVPVVAMSAYFTDAAITACSGCWLQGLLAGAVLP